MNDRKNYEIMSGDREVAVIENGSLVILDEHLAPLYLKRTKDHEKWISDRAIDPGRANSRVLKKLHGISMTASDYETALLYNAACVTDNYWVRKSPSETWEQIRLQSDLYFRAALASDISAFDSKPTRSPELTNTGSREKGWRRLGDEWWLYKNEPEERMNAELLTYELGAMLGMDMAFYEITEGFIRTRDVTGGIYNLQHIDAIVYDHDGINDDDIRYNYSVLHDIDPSLARQYMDIKYMDALVNNVDRHTKNYALLTSRDTGEIVSLAPNYDNDMAFYGYPEILSKDRMLGEIRYFVDANRDIRYEPPLMDEAKLDKLLERYDRGRELKRYLIEGQNIVLDNPDSLLATGKHAW